VAIRNMVFIGTIVAIRNIVPLKTIFRIATIVLEVFIGTVLRNIVPITTSRTIYKV